MPIITVRSSGEPYRQEISADGQQWVSDEPRTAGGQGSGPGPYQLLLSAVGACVSITAQMYARRKEWPLEQVEVTVEGRRTPEGPYEMTLSLKFDGPLTEEQRERLADIANRCPVKKSLSQPILFKSRR